MNDDEELRAAAERIGRLESTAGMTKEDWEQTYGQGGDFRHDVQDDYRTLAQAYLAANPADDERTRSRFAEALYSLMHRFGVIVDHNHDSEALNDGWHFQGSDWTLPMHRAHAKIVPADDKIY